MEMNEILGWIGLAILLSLAVWLIIGYVRDTGDWATVGLVALYIVGVALTACFYYAPSV